ncbi:MAG TPA: HAMP domain-containing sensor histidine kinase [Polyangia bacterium]|jgi:signal transduction histidine kinase|nr:HAMP domain-containing sensor histidine kinase [Polyangia bacterium]
MRRRSVRSISVPIILAGATVGLAIAMLFGWTLVISQNLALTRKVAQNTSLLVAGIVSLSVIIAVLVMLSSFLVRETREVLRQNSFIDSVTHELKSPLASLKLGLDTLARPELTDAQRAEMRQIMLDSVERLSLFIDDVLQASVLAHGRGGHPLSEVRLADLVERCRQQVASRYHEDGEHAISVSVPPDLRLHTDVTALETALKNLLDNAMKYSSRPRQVRVEAHRQGERVILEVSDNGIGIPRRDLKRIFDRFYRVPGEDVRARHGTGLGLFVASALVRNLGGGIEASSAGPGTGARMRVWVPVGGETER